MIEKTAYVLFGGVGSGKSTLAKSLSSQGISALSADSHVYQEDLAQRTGKVFKARERLKQAMAEATGSISLDVMVTSKDLLFLEQSGFQVHALHLKISSEERLRRLSKRKNEINEYRARLGVALDLDSAHVEVRSRTLWRDPTVYERVRISRDELEMLLEQAYTLGAEDYDERQPDPYDFSSSEIRYVTEFSATDDLTSVSVDEITSTRIPFQRFIAERERKPAEVCIWDIGGVVYHYSLETFLGELRARSALSSEEFRRRRVSFDSLMNGAMGFEEFCSQVAERLEVRHGVGSDVLMRALREGVSEPFPETLQIMEKLAKRGVKNALLSNALPVLEAPPIPLNLIPSERRFLSFNTGRLKPDSTAYLSACQVMGVEPSRALFVDDKNRNVQASTHLGLGGIVFKGAKRIATDMKRSFPGTCSDL